MTFEWLREELISILLLLSFENYTSFLRTPEWTQSSLTSSKEHKAHCWHSRAGQQPRLAGGWAGIYHPFCSVYRHYRTLLLLQGPLKAYGKAGKGLVSVWSHPALLQEQGKGWTRVRDVKWSGWSFKILTWETGQGQMEISAVTIRGHPDLPSPQCCANPICMSLIIPVLLNWEPKYFYFIFYCLVFVSFYF